MFQLASREEGQALLRTRDAFIRQLGGFERGIRMGRAEAVDEETFLAFVAGCALEWPEDLRAHVAEAMTRVLGRLGSLAQLWADDLWLVHTSGQEEADSGYTRGAAIFLPPRKAHYPVARLERFLAHELFHVLTRTHSGIRDRLYQLLGFLPCGPVALPERYEAWRITNPDAPESLHAFAPSVGEVAWLPVLHWVEPRFLPGPYFQHVRMSLLPIRALDQGWTLVPEVDPQEGAWLQGHLPVPVDQPEEMLAEVFVQMLLDAEPAPLVEEMRAVLTSA